MSICLGQAHSRLFLGQHIQWAWLMAQFWLPTGEPSLWELEVGLLRVPRPSGLALGQGDRLWGEGETGALGEHQRAGARFIGAFTALVFIIYTLLILGAPVKCVINIKIFYRPVKIPQQK